MKVDLFLYFFVSFIFFVITFTLEQFEIRYYENKAHTLLSRIFFVLAWLFILFPVGIFLFAKPNVQEREYVYETVEQSTDAGFITYKNEDEEVIEKDIDLFPKVYDENGKNNYVAAIRCYIGPFYVVKDCYVYTKT